MCTSGKIETSQLVALCLSNLSQYTKLRVLLSFLSRRSSFPSSSSSSRYSGSCAAGEITLRCCSSHTVLRRGLTNSASLNVSPSRADAIASTPTKIKRRDYSRTSPCETRGPSRATAISVVEVLRKYCAKRPSPYKCNVAVDDRRYISATYDRCTSNKTCDQGKRLAPSWCIRWYTALLEETCAAVFT